MLVVLQSLFPRSVDVPFSLLSVLGSAEVTGVIFLCIVLYAPADNRLSLVFLFGLATLIEMIGKTFIDQPAPPDVVYRYVPILPLVLSEKVTSEFSFPSGHALRTIFIVMVLVNMISASRLTRAKKYLLFVVLGMIEIIMLVSRVYLAEHWTTDVIGGTMLGTAFALIALDVTIPLPRLVTRRKIV